MDIFGLFKPVSPAYKSLIDMMDMYKDWYERERKETARLRETVAAQDAHILDVLSCTSMAKAWRLHEAWEIEQANATLDRLGVTVTEERL